ncbi:MAG: DNA polymerase IV [Bacteroidales bacterium]|nr:DNA polymerase IV [Lachnoclostridium sp.]MCM1383714.1 DNA polymerase IV [Lachnoclostridium sp.]MCM1464342.1 DNA polymerase IV [Bacteroidales bacterium]
MNTAEPIIFHIDVNSAFLSWTALDRLRRGDTQDIRLIPSIIGGDIAKRHGVVLAKSIPAKAYGITTGEPVVNALRKCPNLVNIAPDHALYSHMSGLLMEYLSDICPDIEQASIDECYMNYTPISQKYASPETAAVFLKNSIYEKFGFTVNIGISNRKVLAKMASDFKKPNLVHTLYSWEIREKLWPLPVSSLFMCGHSSVETLHKLGILTIGELAAADPQILKAHLRSHGLILWQYANGQDDREVTPEPAKVKGIGNSITLPEDVTSREEACKALLHLSESVGERLRSSHRLAGLVCTEIKYNTFQSASHQMILEPPTASTDLIYEKACILFDELWNHVPIRLLGVRTSKLSAEDEPVQLNIFDYTDPTREKHQKLDAALDRIRSRYGSDAIKRGSLLDSHDKYQKH